MVFQFVNDLGNQTLCWVMKQDDTIDNIMTNEA